MDFWQNIVFILNFEIVNKGNQNETSRYVIFIDHVIVLYNFKLQSYLSCCFCL